MGGFLFIIFCLFVGSLMYSGGRNPIEYHRETIKRELESERIRKERKEFIDEMIAQDTAPYLSDFKTKRDWATAKRIFLKSDAWKIIRVEVFKKYGKRCVKCGSHSRIEVDHIKPVYNFPTLRLDLNNLQPLCHECNSIKGISSNDYRPKIKPEINVSSSSDTEYSATDIKPNIHLDKTDIVRRNSNVRVENYGKPTLSEILADKRKNEEESQYISKKRTFYNSLSEKQLDELWLEKAEEMNERERELLKKIIRHVKGYDR